MEESDQGLSEARGALVRLVWWSSEDEDASLMV